MMQPKRVVIAPNAFKHSMNAADVARAIEQGLTQSSLACACMYFPVGDGGDGTGDLLIKQQNGQVVPVLVQDPFGRKITSSFGLVNGGKTAVIELANASGIQLVKPEELDPLMATTFGTGELITAALDQGVKHLILAIGGSATVDGGTGILRALGIRFLDQTGTLLTTPESLKQLTDIDLSGLDPRLATCEIDILCDVDNTLLGAEGSAAVFGPQKGASPDDVHVLDTCLAVLSAKAFQQTGIDMANIRHGGAAGGVAAGLHTFLQARLVNGIDFFLDFTKFNEVLTQADLVITGEGSIDEQTLHGKGPFGVARQAKKLNIPVIGLAGKIPLSPSSSLNQYFNVLLAIGNGPTDLTTAFLQTEQNLIRTSRQLGNLLATWY